MLAQLISKYFSEKCDLCQNEISDCKSQSIANGIVVREIESGNRGQAYNYDSHIEVIFNEGSTIRSSYFAKCVFFRKYIILTAVK